jgi:radical SAM protein with 4Fe4S-binding SPASM domain
MGYLPKIASWIITTECNMFCDHCYVDAGRKSNQELNTKEGINVIDELMESGIKMIFFSGGEPILREDFFRLCNYASSRGMFVNVCSNGFELTLDTVKKLKKCGVRRVIISIDSPNSKIHDSFRKCDNAFNRGIKGIKNCISLDMEVFIEATATKLNYLHLDKLVDLAAKLKVKGVTFRRFIPLGRGFLNAQKLSITSRELVFVMKNWLKKQLEYPDMEIKTHEPTYMAFLLKEDLFNPKFLKGYGCLAGREWLGIMPNGDVRVCPVLPITIGNLKDNWKHFWKHSKVVSSLRNRKFLKGKCSKCHFKEVCGGCRAHAFSITSDYLSEDPLCPLIHKRDNI